MAAPFPRLYAIVDADACARAGRAPLDAAAAFVAGGVRLLQVRAKALSGGELLRLVEAVAAIARPAGAAVVVNDRVDVAGAAGVGVHVGQEDLPADLARRLLGPAALVGCSTHTPAQLDAALAAPVSYVAYGPIYATSSKAAPDPVVGLDGLRAAARRTAAAGLPLVAIGGITLDTAPAVIAAGASAVAVIGDLVNGGEPPEARARRFVVALDAADG